MANESQYIVGQIQIIEDLMQDIADRKQVILSFRKAYKEQIDQAYADKMMMETIEKLKNEGFPNYELHVNKAVSRLDELEELLKKAKSSLQEQLDSNSNMRL